MLELQQIEAEFVRLCGSTSARMNAEQFSSLLVQLGFIPDLCQQCFKYVLIFLTTIGREVCPVAYNPMHGNQASLLAPTSLNVVRPTL